MRLKIEVSPDGKEVSGLYSDCFPWNKIGELEVRRASDVFFNPRTQKWLVKILPDLVLSEGFDKRKDAIAYEIAYLQGQL